MGRQRADEMAYLVDDVPPWYLCLFLGFQHYLVMFGATFFNVIELVKALGVENDDNDTKNALIGAIFVAAGLATLLQTTIGCRLPIVQGGSFTFVASVKSLIALQIFNAAKDGKCGKVRNRTATEAVWLPRMREVQGAILVASLFQIFIGFTGIMGFMLRFIGPLAVSPTISLAGLALFDNAAVHASKQWWITLVTVVLIAAFSQYTKNINIPCFTFERGKGCKKIGFPLFRLFPVILAMSITWIICAILTATNVFPSDPDAWGYAAQTGLHIDLLEASPWFRFPYPGQFGMPTVSAAGVFGMLAAVIASMVESVGDYYACARISGARPPPIHAINRGIGIEGIGCILTGAFGSGSGTTSYSENIGAIGITKVASRRVIQYAAVIMILFGLCGKIGTVFVNIPEPITGGVFIVMFGMVTAVGISNLQFVNLNSTRNLFIIGFSFFFGLTLPKYMKETPGVISTGHNEVDKIFTVLLSTSMFVGGLSGFVLDNTIPGTDEERGLLSWRAELVRRKNEQGEYESVDTYDLPFVGKFLSRQSWSRYVPFLPSFSDDFCRISKKTKRKGKKKRHRKPHNESQEDIV
ncbi:hypothetical protein CAPTEDRAFT_124038 [Capitella teleta]|uniref:Solute carrier family 23 member 2 n=1 Tax=Capitella teleta TaxID=283909 RepID=R7T9B3_CAPTE|nr:hypothetical protein CAPTEDRAFT_124038 [Capitella teleta]|eukprot:ELT90298.1 hypothetical protein CAPTEDRAFT_124038 [Capitella teleta]